MRVVEAVSFDAGSKLVNRAESELNEVLSRLPWVPRVVAVVPAAALSVLPYQPANDVPPSSPSHLILTFLQLAIGKPLPIAYPVEQLSKAIEERLKAKGYRLYTLYPKSPTYSFSYS